MVFDILTNALCTIRLEESAGIFAPIDLQQRFVGVIEMVVALVALVIHANAGTIAIVVFRAVQFRIGHVVAALTTFIAFLFPLFHIITE